MEEVVVVVERMEEKLPHGESRRMDEEHGGAWMRSMDEHGDRRQR